MSATQHSRRSRLAAIGMPGSFAIPTGVALTMPSARLEACGEVRYDLDLLCTAGRPQPRCQRFRPIGLHIGHKQPFDAAFQQSVGHRGPGAAGAEQQHLATLRAGQPAAKTLLEPPHVGVVADAPAAAGTPRC